MVGHRRWYFSNGRVRVSFVRKDPLAMGDTERLQQGGGMVVEAGMEGTSPKALTSSIFSFCLFLKCISRSNFSVESLKTRSAQNLVWGTAETS